MKLGQSASLSKTITEADVVLFAGVSMDTNPVHFSDEAASRSVFGSRIVHGMLTASLISGLLGTQFPGPGTIYLEQSLKFLIPVRVGQTITATVEILELLPKRRALVSTVCTNSAGDQVITGEALVILPREA